MIFFTSTGEKINYFSIPYNILLKCDHLTSLRISPYLKYEIVKTFVENIIEVQSESIFIYLF